jgi:hypothetical protein
MSISSFLLNNLIFFSILITFIYNQSHNNQQNTPLNNNNSINENLTESTNSTPVNNKRKKYNNAQQSNIDKERPFNLTYDEMDTMIFCSILVQETLKGRANELENLTKKLNLSSSDQVYDKIGTDIFEYCTKKADIKIVNNYIKHLYYFNNFRWEKSFENYTQINFTKYNNRTDLYFTQSQRILMFLYEKVNEIFRQKRADQTVHFENEVPQENQKIKIGNYDMEQIPLAIKLGIFLVVIILSFGGVFYFLKKMEKKPKDKKKNKKKKNE